MQKRKVFASNLMLIAAAFIWGTQAVPQKLASNRLNAFSFYGARCVMGALTLLLIALILEAQKRKHERENGIEHVPYGKAYFKRLFFVAPLCAVANVTGNILVQLGIHYTTASKTGFLNSIYIIFVPILGWLFFKEKTTVFTWLGTALAVLGLYFLCISDSSLGIQKGDLLVLSCTVFFGLHIQLIGKYVHEFEGVHFSLVEFSFGAIVCLLIGAFYDAPSLSDFAACLPNILYCGVGGIGICYALQVTAQKNTDATVAALLMSLESVFAALSGVFFLNESFTLREFIGVVFIFSAVIIAQLPAPRGMRRSPDR